MAYKQAGHFNADALPAFPEPERHQSPSAAAPSAAPQMSSFHPPRQSSSQQGQQYANKPPPRPDGRQASPALHPGAGGPMHARTSPGPASHMQQQGNGGPMHARTSPSPAQGNGGARHGTPLSRPPPSPAPGSSGPGPQGDPTLLPLFRQVDKDGSGTLTERELRTALVNGDWTSFDPHTITMMIRMFDSDRSGSISFPEFCGLWRFLADWRSLFDRFDVDRSGTINLNEYQNALTSFGYRLSSGFIETMFRQYDKRNEGNLSFDLFVQSCISLKRMTDVFKKYDDDRDGYITLGFEDFLREILRQR